MRKGYPILPVMGIIAVFAVYGISEAKAAPLSNATGLVQNFAIDTGGYTFPLTVTSNFDVTEISFEEEEKRLTLEISSLLENNIAEIVIPQNLIGGNFTFLLDNTPVFPDVKNSTDTTLVVLRFEGNGTRTLDIIGTTYLPEFGLVATFVLVAGLAAATLAAKRYSYSLKSF